MAVKKSAPCAAYPDWTEAKFWGYVRSGLRSKATRWPPKYTVKQRNKRAYSGPNPRQKFEYKCDGCGNYFPDKEVEVDHIEPVGSLLSFEDLPGFVERLFCPVEGLQLLCKDGCHRAKTNKEREEAKNGKG